MWSLALAYRKTADLDEDRAKAYELEQVSCYVKFLLPIYNSSIDKSITLNVRYVLNAESESREFRRIVTCAP